MKMAFSSLNGTILVLALLMAGASGTASAVAQDEDQVKDLLACDKIKNPEDKLECFNAVIEILKQQEAEKDVANQSADNRVMRRRSTEVTSPRRSDFGLSQAQIEAREDAANPGRKKEPKEQTFQFTHHWRDAAGKYYFLMSNGQVWKEAGGSHLIIPKRAKTIRIKRNFMGGYAAFIEGMNGRKGRVKRVR